MELDDYRAAFEPRFTMSRSDDGVLVVQWHQFHAGEPIPPYGGLVGSPPSLQVAGDVWNAIGEDDENRVVVVTGADGSFFDLPLPSKSTQVGALPFDADVFTRIIRKVSRSLDSFLDIPTPLIGAASGPAFVHSEYLLACDLVIASETAQFADRAHYIRDLVPGDGTSVLWPLLLGYRRAADYILTGRVISASEALDFGLVTEVVPEADLMPRCMELASMLAGASGATRRSTAMAMRQRLRRMFRDEVHHTMALEGLTYIDRSR